MELERLIAGIASGETALKRLVAAKQPANAWRLIALRGRPYDQEYR